LCFVIAWYFILQKVYRAVFPARKIKDEKVRTSVELEKVTAFQKTQRGLGTLVQSRPFLIQLAITVFLTMVFMFLLAQVLQGGAVVNTFDPYSILEIDHGSDNKAIKKAYRTLSLKYHPDKNPNNRVAATKFMMIAKAYEALTDETARSNYEKYGNPDGKQSLAVSIGLPVFLLESQNRNLVLVVYLVFMVGLVPWGVFTYYSNSSQYGEKNIMYDTYAWLHNTLHVNTTTTRQLPEVMAGSAEFRKRNMPASAEERNAIAAALLIVKPHMNKPKWTHPVLIKGNVLLHLYLLRKVHVTAATATTSSTVGTGSDAVVLDAKTINDLQYMLRISPSLISAMMSVCKNMDALQTAVAVIEFSQYLTQALWTKDSPLLQIPHLTPELISNHITSKKGGAIKTVADYAALHSTDRPGLADMTSQQKLDVAEFLKIYPNMSLQVKVFVDDDEDTNVYEGDLVTVRVIVTRHQLDTGYNGIVETPPTSEEGANTKSEESVAPKHNDDAKVGLVHAPHFPFPRQEMLWIVLGQLKENKIITIDKVLDPRRVVQHDIKFMAPPTGKYHFDLLVKSNGYIGVDLADRIEMNVMDNSVLPEYKVHPDDARLDDEPTLFEEMLNAQNIDKHEDSDNEDDDDDDDENDVGDNGDEDDEKEDDEDEQDAGVSGSSAVARKRALLRKAAGQNDDSDDDDE
jgi:translocation protein SEC63